MTYQQLQRDCTLYQSLPRWYRGGHSNCCAGRQLTAASDTASKACWPAFNSLFCCNVYWSWRHCITYDKSLKQRHPRCLGSIAKLTYLIVMIWGQQTVERRHRFEADVLVGHQFKCVLRQVWQILKVNDVFLLCPPAVL